MFSKCNSFVTDHNQNCPVSTACAQSARSEVSQENPSNGSRDTDENVVSYPHKVALICDQL